MTKHPPNRRGITFEVGAQLEARDRLKKWYAFVGPCFISAVIFKALLNPKVNLFIILQLTKSSMWWLRWFSFLGLFFFHKVILSGHIWIKIRTRYGHCGWTEVNLAIDFCLTALLDFSHLISAAGYRMQCWSVYSDCGEVSLLSEYNDIVGRIPSPTSNVWMGELVVY